MFIGVIWAHNITSQIKQQVIAEFQEDIVIAEFKEDIVIAEFKEDIDREIEKRINHLIEFENLPLSLKL